MRDVTDETFEQEVLAAGTTVIVDFWAPWCGPCRAIEPALAAIAEASARVELVRVDVDANPVTAGRCGVLSLPTVTLFAGGVARETVHGARPRKHFERAFAAYL